MNAVTAAALEPVDNACIALESVDIQANLRGLMSEVVVTQSYRNLEKRNIEAVYTFPLPLDAVLLDLVLDLNGKTLRGVVQLKNKAEDRYEDAIDEGDSAILLQQLEPGIFTLNVGNILPNEQAVIRFRYAQLHHWQGDSLRFHLPTTIAPRYGDPSASGLAPHQVPEHALSAGYGFSLIVRIEGELAGADFNCPSHLIRVSTVSTNNDAREIVLSGGSALMDRDFVLVLKEPAERLVEGLWAPDQEMYVVLASFHPVFPEAVPGLPRCITLVVDCSGSMAGDSIAQAKVALHDIISSLKSNDFFNLITFGSSDDQLFRQPVAANDKNIRIAARFVERIDANMGGTEIASALAAAYRYGTIAGLRSDLLLITDGEVWNHDQVVRQAQKSGHRIFTVGVGSTVSEAFVRRIADATSGACELVSPRESMAERIVRHFQRIDQPGAKSIRIEWPTNPVRQFPGELQTVYAGDTLHVLGWFRDRPAGKVRLVMTFDDGRAVTQEQRFAAPGSSSEQLLANLPRIAAHARLLQLDENEAAELAGRYQLVTEYTSCILVFEREADQKSGEIPALRKVPQTLAAGWGGMGSIIFEARGASCERLYEHRGASWARLYEHRDECSFVMLEIPHRRTPSGFDQLIVGLNGRYPDRAPAHLDIKAIYELVALGLDREIAARLADFALAENDKEAEARIIICFLVHLSNSHYGRGLSRHVERLIRRASKQNTVSTMVDNLVSALVNDKI